MTEAFDADVLIYAASGHPAAPKLRALLFGDEPLIGSMVLLPETLSKPMRAQRDDELAALLALLGRLDLAQPLAELGGDESES